MATDDRQILVVGQENTPAAWLVPGNGQVTPRTVFAHYNGTGAGGSFVPALKVISDGGETVGIYPCGTTLAAGASADVSWFPGVTPEPATLSNPGLMAARVNITGSVSIPEGDPGVFVTWGEAPVDTGTPTSFWSATHPQRLTAPVSGIYLSMANLNWDVIASGNTPAYVGTYLYKNGASSPNFFYEYNTAEAVVDPLGSAYNLTAGHHGIFAMNAGDYFEILAYNFNEGGVARKLIDLRPTQNHYCSWQMILVSTL